MTLYKYMKPDRVDVLERNLIRYTPPAEFNDPFESAPHSASFATAEEIARVTNVALPHEGDRVWAELPAELRAKIERSEYDRLVAGLAPAATSMFADLSKGLAPVFLAQATRRANETLGILSLSDRPDSLLMWAHYAAAHTGVVVGIDPTHNSFNPRESRAASESNVRKVSYAESRPSKPLMELSPEEFFFTKSLEWSYEAEWRALARLTDAVEVKPSRPWPIHLFPLPADCIRVVILGCRATAECKERVVSILADERYQGVKLLTARVDDRQFTLNLVEIAR